MASVDAVLELRVLLSFRCSNLPRKDVLSKSDPYVELSVFDDTVTKSWVLVGRTETIQNNHNPKFIQQIEIPFRFEEEQTLMIRVFDDDFGQKQDDFLGEALCKLGQIMGARGQVLRLKLQNSRGRDTRATVTVSAEQSPTTSAGRGILHLRLAGRNLDRKDGWFGKSDPFYVIQRSKTGRNDDFEDVYKSEYKIQTLNPEWTMAHIPAARLVTAPRLRLEVSDRDPTKTDLIGYADITLEDLKRCRRDIPLIHPPTKSKYTKSSYANSGLVDVLSCRLEEKFTMIDYLRGGLQIQLCVAVDFTGSNGDPNVPGSLHYGNGLVPNAYMDAIEGVGKILLHYDSDKMVPAFGFGAKPSPGAPVSHLFPLNGNSNDPSCFGVTGILDAYRSVFQRRIVLSGPTYFSQIVNYAAQYARTGASSSSSLSYTVLLLLTDGVINDMDKTIDAICLAASEPLSIIIVGLGQADFTPMVALDADVSPLIDSRGKQCSRDIVQFVPFNKVRNNPDLLAKETLAELPEQISSFFGRIGIKPGNPIFVDPDAASLHTHEGDIPTAMAVPVPRTDVTSTTAAAVVNPDAFFHTHEGGISTAVAVPQTNATSASATAVVATRVGHSDTKGSILL